MDAVLCVAATFANLGLAYRTTFAEGGAARHLDAGPPASCAPGAPDRFHGSSIFCFITNREADVSCPVHEGPVHSSAIARNARPGKAALLDTTEPLLWGRVKDALEKGEENNLLGHMMLGEALAFRGSVLTGSISEACVACAAWHACFNAGVRRAVLMNFSSLCFWLLAGSALAASSAPAAMAVGRWAAAALVALAPALQARCLLAWALFCRKSKLRCSLKWLSRQLDSRPWALAAASLLVAGSTATAPDRPVVRRRLMAKDLSPLGGLAEQDEDAGTVDAGLAGDMDGEPGSKAANQGEAAPEHAGLLQLSPVTAQAPVLQRAAPMNALAGLH